MRKLKKEKEQIKKLKELGFVTDAKIVKVGRGTRLRITFKETVLGINAYYMKTKKKRVNYKKYFYLGKPRVDIGLYSCQYPRFIGGKVICRHPHINGERCCFGDQRATLDLLLEGFNFEMAAFVIWKWLHTYNKGHGYCGVNTLTSNFQRDYTPIWKSYDGKRIKNTTHKIDRYDGWEKNAQKFRGKKLEGLI